MPRKWPLLACILSLLPGVLHAQGSVALPGLGSLVEDRARLAQLIDSAERAVTIRGHDEHGARDSLPVPWLVLRDGGALGSVRDGWRWVRPTLQFTHQSQLPVAENDGALWSGRGANFLLRGGATWRRGRLSITIAPELVHSRNDPFEARPAAVPDWVSFASPWRTIDAPADLPQRFGDRLITALHSGQSTLVYELPSIAVGISTGNLWWGPGVRNALVLGNAAPGIPRAFLRTPAPLATRWGDLHGEYFVGGLTESLFFDRNSGNDLRGVSGLALSFAPRHAEGLTVGLTRLVTAKVSTAGAISSHALAVVSSWNNDRRDQMSSLFFRWVAPASGVEVWGEYARSRLPDTWRVLLTEPNADMGWTAGAQWAVPRPRGVLRVQAEFTDVAQSVVDLGRPPRDWGTGRHVLHGFTQRGQMLGLATGPGSTHGWLALDYLPSAWGLGAYVARTRWENDAYYRQGIISFFGHDVSLFGGVRGHWRRALYDVSTSATWERRFNYQFENGTVTPNNRGQRTYDNVRVTVFVTPR